MRRLRTTLPGTLPKSFEALCQMHWPRPVHDAAEYQNTAEVVDRLALLPARTADQADYLEALSTLLEKYDKDLPPDKGVEDDRAIVTLKYLMKGHGMTASDLGRLLGNRTLGAAILRGARRISRASAIALGGRFKVDPALFFQA